MTERNNKLIQEKYREYLIPSVLSSAALAVASLVDSMLVGQLLGKDALAGVGACSPIVALGNAAFLVFSVGGSTTASIALGERDTVKAKRCYTVSIYFGMMLIIALALVMELFAGPLCLAMCYGDRSLASAMIGYYRPLLFVFPALFMTLGVAQYMRIDGHPKMGSYIAVASNIVNLILDYIFIKYLNLGITGASLSTLCGYLAGLFLVIPWLLNKDKPFGIVRTGKELIPLLKEIFSAGSSRFFLSIADFLKRFFLNSLILKFLGNTGLSILTVCNSLMFFATSITNGGSEAFLPIVGSLLGEKDLYGIRECIKSALKVVLSGCVVLTLILFIMPSAIGSLFGLNTGETAGIIPVAFRLLALSYPFMGIVTVMRTHYNTTGRHKISTAMSVLSEMVYLCAFVAVLGLTVPGILWAGFPAAQAATLVTAYIYSLCVQRREDVSAFLLLKKPEDDVTIRSVTIEATEADAVGLSEQVIEEMGILGLESSTANRIAVAVEEMAVAVARHRQERHKPQLIDIMFVLDKDEKTVSFRDNGALFDPLAGSGEDDEGPGSGIQVLKSIVKSVDFSRQLGFNTTILKF